MTKLTKLQRDKREIEKESRELKTVCRCEDMFFLSQMRTAADPEGGTRVCLDLQPGGKSPCIHPGHYRLAKAHHISPTAFVSESGLYKNRSSNLNPALTEFGKLKVVAKLAF